MNEQPLTTTRPLTSEEREQTWAEEKSQAVKSAARAHQPSVDARKAFGFAPMSLKGADYSWPGQQEDEPRYCEACNGMGWTWEEKQVGERKSDIQTIAVHCDKCEGTGYET